MGWLHNIFGATHREPGSGATEFAETDSNDQERLARNAPRRELVQMVLRDTMRQHGIPSDWIECRILSAVSSSGRTGMHVNFVVRQAHDRLLHYVFAFQQSFERELSRFEPRARDWVLSLGWEFQNFQAGAEGMPAPGSWGRAAAPVAPGPSAVGDGDGSGMESGFAPTADPMANERSRSDDEVQRDLAALFAIRDAAMADAARKSPPAGHDFDHTKPSEDSGGARR